MKRLFRFCCQSLNCRLYRRKVSFVPSSFRKNPTGKMYLAWKRGFPGKFAHFVWFYPIKKRVFFLNLFCGFDFFLFRTLAANSVSDFVGGGLEEDSKDDKHWPQRDHWPDRCDVMFLTSVQIFGEPGSVAIILLWVQPLWIQHKVAVNSDIGSWFVFALCEACCCNDKQNEAMLRKSPLCKKVAAFYSGKHRSIFRMNKCKIIETTKVKKWKKGI